MRPNANYEINKIIDCANKSLGCAAYVVILVNLEFVLPAVININLIKLKMLCRLPIMFNIDKLFLQFLKN